LHLFRRFDKFKSDSQRIPGGLHPGMWVQFHVFFLIDRRFRGSLLPGSFNPSMSFSKGELS